MPPTRTEVGPGWNGAGRFTHVAVGAHLGSLVRNGEMPVELGGGFSYETAPSSDEMTTASAGGFLDVGYIAKRTEHARIIVGARGEKFYRGASQGAAKLRVDLELITHNETSFAGDDGCSTYSGGTTGNLAIGAYAEGGPTWLADDTHGWTATAGVSMRLPAWGMVAIGSCGSRRGSHSGGHGSFSGVSGSRGGD